jgi:phytoene synthase
VAAVENKDANTVTRTAGSSFYAAMRILPQAQRQAMFEIYAFCRLVDDIADSDLPRAERSAKLARWRADIHAMFADASPPHLQGLAQATRAFSLRRDDFLAVIDGMEMDAREDIRAPDFATLDLYCDRVASAVGRLSVRIFGMPNNDGLTLAHHLGRALQLTNILRDLDEDAAVGRLYLPREALDRAGITTSDPASVLASRGLAQACEAVVARARGHFAEAEVVMRRSRRRAVRAPRIMGEVYHLILDRMVARGWSPRRERVRLPRWRLIPILLRYAIV